MEVAMATAPTNLEQQLAAICSEHDLTALQINVAREDDGSHRFYVALHGVEGGCVFGAYNEPTVSEAIGSGLTALRDQRFPRPPVAAPELAPIAEAA
jgi:hypothetical protein